MTGKQKIADLLDVPSSQIEAMALAKYLTKHAYGNLPNKKDFDLIEQGYSPKLPGTPTIGWQGVELLEKVLSWFSRPYLAATQVSADLDYLFKMEPKRS